MYNSLSDKVNVFNYSIINNEVELQRIISDMENKSGLRFRGVCEAKYTMLTSLQRNCPSEMHEKQKEYMTVLLQRIKNCPDVIAYFNNMGIAINDISCLALMQHYGLPTPLLDFSIDVNIALSFAADGLTIDKKKSEIDKYASLYVFNKEDEYEVGITIQQILENGMARGKQLLHDHLREKSTEYINASILYNINEFIRWNDIKDIELAFIEYQPLAPGVVTLSGQKLDLSNPNLIRQKGCFLLNLYNETMPLEENWNMRTNESMYKYWLNREPGFEVSPFSGVKTRDKICCFDIKKEVLAKWADKNRIQLYDNTTNNITIKEKMQNIKTTLDEEIRNNPMLGI